MAIISRPPQARKATLRSLKLSGESSGGSLYDTRPRPVFLRCRCLSVYNPLLKIYAVTSNSRYKKVCYLCFQLSIRPYSMKSSIMEFILPNQGLITGKLKALRRLLPYTANWPVLYIFVSFRIRFPTGISNGDQRRSIRSTVPEVGRMVINTVGFA